MQRGVVIRVSALGDVVLTDAVGQALKARFPGIHLTLVTDPRYAGLMRASSFDEVVPFDRHQESAGSVMERLGSEPFDVLLDLQGKVATRRLASLIAAPQKFRIKKRTLTQSLLSVVGVDPPIHDRHATQVYLDTLAPLQLSFSETYAPRLTIEPEGLAFARPAIGVAPSASHGSKRWAPERFASLIDALAEHFPEASFHLVGGEVDRAVLDAVKQNLRNSHRVDDSATRLDVLTLAERIAGFDRFISCDSGPAHIAAALGVPTTVLFGPTSDVRWRPIGSAHQSIRHPVSCAPCSNTGTPQCPKPRAHHVCLNGLEVNAVREQILQHWSMLDAHRGSDL